MDSDHKDLLMMFYEQNKERHRNKERVIWLAGTVYFAFSALVCRWLLEIPKDWFRVTIVSRLVVFIFLFFIFVLVFWYLCFQNVQKCKAIAEDERFKSMIRTFGGSLKYLAGPRPVPDKDRCFLGRRYIPGVIVISVASLFLVAQGLLLLTKC